ncbi:MAG: hypothetical protein LBK53_08200 [Heliobacteriaceae bacterium]|jgi:hypothetical protein|nr:hypothetical protein [Heliobacteriaceae bacterium]
MVNIKAIQSFIKASSAKSILQTKPTSLKNINPAELKADVVELGKNVNIDIIPLHSNRSIHSNNGYIREICTDGVQNFIEEYSKKHAVKIIDIINKIDSQFLKLTPLPESRVAYRGVYENFRNSSKRYIEKMFKAQPGDIIVPDTAYSFNAANKAVCKDFTKKDVKSILYEIRLPKGSRVSYGPEYGGEYVIQRGAHYKVISKEIKTDGSMDMVLELIPDKLPKPIKLSDELKQYKEYLINKGKYD